MNFQSHWVLVTGASSGLGEALARKLAQQHRANLILVARRGERLQQLKRELEANHRIQVVALVADLTQHDQIEHIFQEATFQRNVYAVIFNAGVTSYRPAAAQSDEDIQTLLATNVTSVIALSQRFIRYFLAQPQGGGMLFISSLAGQGPMPFQAVYAASKSFLTHYALSLRYELRGKPISITVAAPGGIATEMLELSGLSKKFNPRGLGIMSAPRCADLTLRAFQRRRAMYVPGILNKLLALAYKLAPSTAVTAAIGRLYQQPQWQDP